MNKKEKGQVSLEFIMILGVFLLIVLTLYPHIQRENEFNKALASAMDGAIYAASERGMGYACETCVKLPSGTIKIINMTLEDRGIDQNGRKAYRIRFYISVPTYIKDRYPSCYNSPVGISIRRQAIRYIYRAFYGSWNPPNPLEVCTDRYNFTTTCSYAE